MIKVEKLKIPDVLLITPVLHPDNRGIFFENYKLSFFSKLNLPPFVQDNISISRKNVIRGLHYQREPYSQGKLISVLRGKIFDVAVDIRKKSNTFGKYISVHLDDNDRKMLYIPPGFAHGFCSLTNDTIITYKNTREYNSNSEDGIIWNDPDIGISWPCNNPILSVKDSNYNTLNNISSEH